MWQSVTTQKVKKQGVKDMMNTRNVIIAFMSIFGIVMGMASAGVDYSTDIYMKNAPLITMVDPVGDQAAVTAPIGYTGRVIFVDIFGRHVKQYNNITMGIGETRTFDVPLVDNMGNIGVYTDYYNMPGVAKLGGAPNIGSDNNAIVNQWYMVAYLGGKMPLHAGKTYQSAPNGAWVWNAKR